MAFIRQGAKNRLKTAENAEKMPKKAIFFEKYFEKFCGIKKLL